MDQVEARLVRPSEAWRFGVKAAYAFARVTRVAGDGEKPRFVAWPLLLVFPGRIWLDAISGTAWTDGRDAVVVVRAASDKVSPAVPLTFSALLAAMVSTLLLTGSFATALPYLLSIVGVAAAVVVVLWLFGLVSLRLFRERRLLVGYDFGVTTLAQFPTHKDGRAWRLAAAALSRIPDGSTVGVLAQNDSVWRLYVGCWGLVPIADSRLALEVPEDLYRQSMAEHQPAEDAHPCPRDRPRLEDVPEAPGDTGQGR